MRLFFALEAEPATALELANWRDTRLVADGRPVPPANFHITLAFIGELSHAKVDRLADAVDTRLEDSPHKAGSLSLDSPGYWSKAGIYWLGPAQWPQDLGDLARKLRGLATGAGARKDNNPFRPHVTLFRRCERPPAAPITPPAIGWHYGHFSLMESVQGKGGVSYRAVTGWGLS